jgi:CBS domain-containing protein
MVERGINRLPVVDEGRLVGISTRADLVRAFHRSDKTAELVAAYVRRVPGVVAVRSDLSWRSTISRVAPRRPV